MYMCIYVFLCAYGKQQLENLTYVYIHIRMFVFCMLYCINCGMLPVVALVNLLQFYADKYMKETPTVDKGHQVHDKTVVWVEKSVKVKQKKNSMVSAEKCMYICIYAWM